MWFLARLHPSLLYFTYGIFGISFLYLKLWSKLIYTALIQRGEKLLPLRVFDLRFSDICDIRKIFPRIQFFSSMEVNVK